ncbi:MAG: 3-phosphoshikimate 1-carboxyvinyltransferase [Clostridiaceae bacterium]|jgi:3-phosphoshikimate 1-carboxyvinyltransferase|nr:3-phosphoshikimate 1-carboxyvinyltransferase [Oscillospiraceae bacterium]NLO63057.1 3-phosphoshikimate 1-carboxyvinyltransferase [Clostridiaceae bacterium]
MNHSEREKRRYAARNRRNGTLSVYPGVLVGSVRTPLSKSLLHRALIMAMLAGDLDLVDLKDQVVSEDIEATLDCLGVLMRNGNTGDEIELFCNESGSTLRFLIPLVAVLGRRAVFSGTGRLPHRPLREYENIFRGTGVKLTFPDDGTFLPLHVEGRLNAGRFEVPGNVSSQYITGLLLALSAAKGDSEIVITTRLESEPYIEMTRDVMRSFGVFTAKEDNVYTVRGGQRIFREKPYLAEPDFSHAAFWYVANFLGSDIEILDMSPCSSQGDSEILPLLAELERFSGSSASRRSDACFNIDAAQIPDLIPVLSVACASAPCDVRIFNAGRLRLKECDRLEATWEMLGRLGVRTEKDEDELRIFGDAKSSGEDVFRACTIDSHGDHRIVMAAAVAATRADGPVRIMDFGAVRKSYPNFFRDFRRLGGKTDELDVG